MSKFDVKKEIEKTKWYVLLFMAITFFLLAMVTGNVFFNIPTIILSFIVYKYGSHVLFKELDERQKKKSEQARMIFEETQAAINSRKIKMEKE